MGATKVFVATREELMRALKIWADTYAEDGTPYFPDIYDDTEQTEAQADYLIGLLHDMRAGRQDKGGE